MYTTRQMNKCFWSMNIPEKYDCQKCECIFKKNPGRRLFLHTCQTFICMGFWKLPPRNLMFKTKIDPPSKYIKTKKEFIISQFNFSTNSRLLELFIAFIGGFTDENFTKKIRLRRIKTVLFWVSWRKDVICISHF